MFNHSHTVSTLNLAMGDIVIQNGNRVVASVERNMSNLGAAIIRFSDGSFFTRGCATLTQSLAPKSFLTPVR